MGVFVYWPETKNLCYAQTLEFIFNKDNFYNAVIDTTICTKCGKTQYHSLIHCNCGGKFVTASYSISAIMDRIKTREHDKAHYDWVISSFRDTLYCEFSFLLETRLRKEYSGDVSSKVNRDFYTRCRALVN